jgi:DNA polymerase-4/protein ImuB
MSIACLTVPSLGLACELAGRPRLAGSPVALADETGLRVADATPEAARRGVRRGLTLREATALCPRLAVLEPRPARVARAAEGLVEAMATVSPLVEEVEPGVVLADLIGLDALYPRPGQIERAILEATPAALPARLGVAEERFTAIAAARSAPLGEAQRVAPGEGAAFLAERPAHWLPLGAEALAQLRLLGITTVGAFAALPHHAVQAQFGVRGARAWLAARGADPAPVRPRPAAGERVIERVRAQPSFASREVVLRTAEQLLRRVLLHPRASGRFVRVLRLRAVTEEDQLWERVQPLREPTGDRDRLWTVIRSAIEHAEFPGPVAELELELGGLTAETGRQPGLFADHARRRAQLDEMVRHLSVRFGHSPVAQVVGMEPWSRLPERRYALMDYDP